MVEIQIIPDEVVDESVENEAVAQGSVIEGVIENLALEEDIVEAPKEPEIVQLFPWTDLDVEGNPRTSIGNIGALELKKLPAPIPTGK